jgi:uncharacterized protein (TIGR02246 family)
VTPDDRLALHDLVHRYAAYVDDRELDRAAALFALDGELVPSRGEPAVGRPAVRAALAAVERVDATRHTVTGIVLDRTGPHAATGRVSGEAHHLTEETDHVWHLVYRDAYRRLDGRWHFARRALEIVGTEDRPVSR